MVFVQLATILQALLVLRHNVSVALPYSVKIIILRYRNFIKYDFIVTAPDSGTPSPLEFL